MPDDAPLKSSYELAMERLRAKDKAAGIDESAPLTAKQKARIAELRAATQAELAQLEIMLEQELAVAGGDPAKIAEVEEHYQRDRARAESTLESGIAGVRRNEDEDD